MARKHLIQNVLLALLCITLAAACTPSPQQAGFSATLPFPTAALISRTQAMPTDTQVPTKTSSPTRSATPAYTETATAGLETALVVQVLDGDTIEVLVAGVTQRLRYIGIDSPEDGQPFSAEAESLNRDLVEGKQVILEKDVSETDRYDRLLRYVYLPDGTFVNAELVRAGLAQAAAYEPDTAYQGYFEQMQSQAQAEGLGIWGEPLPTATIPPTGDGILIDPACSQFNAPGNDNDNKNEEYACIVNQGAAVIDLSGWALHDDYGWNYTFPTFTLGAGANVLVRTGCGEDTGIDLYWCRDETAVWNNDGDCASLLDAAGKVVYEYCY